MSQHVKHLLVLSPLLRVKNSPSNKAPQYGTYVQQHIAAEEAYKTSRTRSVRRLESGGDIACHIMRHARHIKAPSILCT